MSLASVFQRKKNAPQRPVGDAAVDDADDPQWERTRARRRLIGAVLLLGVAVVGFPWLFESEPRPIARDLPIDVARRDAGTVSVAPPLPAPRPAPESASAPTLPPPQAAPELAASAPAAAAVKPSASAALAKAASSTVIARTGAASAVAAGVPARVPDAAASQVAGDAAVEAKGRFVVQVGAFTDAGALREARQRVEKLGLKTYTQVVETPAGTRTRVRVGPFATREEAEKAGARLKAAGLPAYQLAL